MTYQVECVWPVSAQLGEGPMWVADQHTLWFVDIKGRHIHCFNEKTGERKTWETPEFSAFIFPASNGKFICGLKSGLYEFDQASGQFTLRVRVDAEHRHNRLNDGYVDARGRLWFGTMDNTERNPTGSLYCFADSQIKRLDTNYVVTNGPAMSPDGTTLYHIDSQQQLVYAFDVDPRGVLGNKRVFLKIDEAGVYPDGPAVDVNGNVWIAMFGGWGVRCYSPQGKLLDKVDVPASNCTKIAFGGDDLKTMYVTTAWVGLSDEQRKQQPLAGGLFKFQVEAAGLPQNQFVI
ncbi:MAG TPA: SMP-30/gluconolactonase/LRE family protein [Steroidobacteraceae bacterium]|jgi:sugar lactone lactonase YvrE|nr:SMP-30/gluconolactonase/LRE family protein [Steroidobacteraceae bacterium]